MMSDLPGEMTKQILSAPPRIMRSTRYSLTAHGRSTPLSRRLPTGSNSFENARGWMRLPTSGRGHDPPHAQASISVEPSPCSERSIPATAFRVPRPLARGVLLERRSRAARRCAAVRHRRDRCAASSVAGARHEDLAARLKNASSPPTHPTGSACRRRRPRTGDPTGTSPFRHRLARDVEGQPARRRRKRGARAGAGGARSRCSAPRGSPGGTALRR